MTHPDHTATGSTGHDPEATEATEPVRPAGGGSLRPVAVLAVGSFAMGTDSFVLAGILPNIAGGLHVSTAAAGQTITVFALTYALAAPLLAGITGALPRKPLMLAALGLFVLANLASAAAPTLALLLVARVAAGLGAALYTPNASAAATALVSPARRGRALAMVLGGLTVGTVLGVPVGTAIGQRISWQASLIFVAVVGLVALLGILVTLPSLALPPAVPLRARFALLGNRRVLAIVAVMLLASAASISVYTYIAVVLAHTAHITGTTLAAVLLTWGAGGAVGAFGSGALTDRYGPGRTLLLAITTLTVTLAALTAATSVIAVFVVMAVNGAAAWAVATPNNHRLTALAPALPGVVISLNSSGIYLGQALGAAAGGLLLDHQLTPDRLPLVGAALSVVALTAHLLTIRKKAFRVTERPVTRSEPPSKDSPDYE